MKNSKNNRRQQFGSLSKAKGINRINADIGAADSAIIALANVTPSQFPRFTEGGVIYALNDPQNFQGESPDPAKDRPDGFIGYENIDTGGGVIKSLPTVRIRNYRISSESTQEEKNCNAEPAPMPAEERFSLKYYRQKSISIPLKRIQELKNDAARVYNSGTLPDGTGFRISNTPIMEEVRKMLYSNVFEPLIRDINKDLFLELLGGVGVNFTTGNNAAKNVNLFDANGDKVERGFRTVMTDYQKNLFSKIPIMLGGGIVSDFAWSVANGCCNDSGLDWQKVVQSSRVATYYDNTADNLLGTDQFLIIAPETAKLVTFSSHRIMFLNSKRHGSSEFGIITVPEFPNFQFDLQVKENDCTEPSWDFIVSLYYDVYTPDNIYDENHRFNGVNGILRYQAS